MWKKKIKKKWNKVLLYKWLIDLKGEVRYEIKSNYKTCDRYIRIAYGINTFITGIYSNCHISLYKAR